MNDIFFSPILEKPSSFSIVEVRKKKKCSFALPPPPLFRFCFQGYPVTTLGDLGCQFFRAIKSGSKSLLGYFNLKHFVTCCCALELKGYGEIEGKLLRCQNFLSSAKKNLALQ